MADIARPAARPVTVGPNPWLLLDRWPVLGVGLALVLLYFLMPEKGLATQILVFGLYATSFNLLLGYAGLLSFGHSTYLGVGAYTTGLLLRDHHAPVLLAMVGGVLMATLFAVVLGWFCLRRRKVYFSLLTLAFNQMVFFIFFQARDITGGDDGLRNIPIPTIDIPLLGSLSLEGIRHPENRYFFVLAFVLLSLLTVQRIIDSPFGRVLQSIRESEERAQALGYDTNRILWLAFIFAGAFGGLAGSLWALLAGFVAMETLNWLWAGDAVLMTIVGGAGTFVGPFVGAAVFQVLREYVSKNEALLGGMGWQFYTGVIFVCCVLFFPQGVWGTLKKRVLGRIAAPPTAAPSARASAEPAVTAAGSTR